jgi:predicted ATPase
MSDLTFFVGENGSGKSTLLEAIAYQCNFNTAGGNRNHTYKVQAASSDLGDYIRLSWLPKVTNGFFLRAESFYHFATHIDEVDDTGFTLVTSAVTWRIVFIPFLTPFQRQGDIFTR